MWIFHEPICKVLFIYLFKRQSDRERRREKALPPTGWPPKWPQWPFRRQEPGALSGLSVCRCLPKHVMSKVAGSAARLPGLEAVLQGGRLVSPTASYGRPSMNILKPLYICAPLLKNILKNLLFAISRRLFILNK